MAEIEDRPTSSLPVPPLDLIERVTGLRDEHLYKVQGRATVRDWSNGLGAIGKKWGDFGRIVDFGCGCGRVARHMADIAAHSSLVGVDTDAEAVTWCVEHIPWADFMTVDPYPPMPFAAKGVDLILGHSVFTHMPEDIQDLWLAELRRVLSPSGVALLTESGEVPVQGLEKTWRDAGADPMPLRERFDQYGLLHIADDSWRDPQFKGYFPDYYHSTFHSIAYIERHWSKFFRVRGILLQAALSFQNIVILEAE